MKRFTTIKIPILILVLLFFAPTQLKSQCVPGAPLVSTDPDNPDNQNKPAFENYFDWTYDRNVDVYLPQGGYELGPLIPYQTHLPFYKNLEYMKHVNYFSLTNPNDHIPENLDMHPEDGWELISRHFGYELDETTIIPTSTRRRPAPYFILYNKYTATFRIFAALALGHNQSVETSLKHRIGNDIFFSGMLGHYGNVSQPLDVESSADVIGKLSPYGGNKEWTVADFNIAYDPCVCNNDSRLTIQFQTLTVASVELDGRFVATSVPLTGTGNDDLINGRDFLLAVKKDGFDVHAGMQTYSNIDSLISKYKRPAGLSDLEKQALDLFGKGLKSGAKYVDKEASKYINTRAGELVDGWVDNNHTLHQQLIKHDVKTGSTKLATGLKIGLAAAGADLIISAITPDKPSVPNVHFIEGEIVMSGEVKTTTGANADEINLFTPGSPNTNVLLTDWLQYPSYNEPLGLFAVTKTPQVKEFDFYYNGWDGFNATFNGANLARDHGKQFQLNDLQYTFNPAAGVNVDKTLIHIAFALQSTATADSVGDFHKMPAKATVPPQQWNEYVTDFVSLDCAQNVGASWEETGTTDFCLKVVPGPCTWLTYPTRNIPDYQNVRIKIMIQYEFNENQYGKVHTTFKTLTYPIEIVPVTYSSFDPAFPAHADEFEEVRIERLLEFPVFRSFDVATTFTSNQTFLARDNIVISANLSTAPGVHVIMKAEEIDVLEGVDISPSIELIATSPASCNSPIVPLSQSQVDNFCNGSNYKANQAQPKRKPDFSETSPGRQVLEEEIFEFSLFPNPGKQHVYLRYNTPTGELLRITVRNIQGRVVKVQNVTGGKNQVALNTDNLSKGVFTVSLESSQKVLTKKLVLLQ